MTSLWRRQKARGWLAQRLAKEPCPRTWRMGHTDSWGRIRPWHWQGWSLALPRTTFLAETRMEL